MKRHQQTLKKSVQNVSYKELTYRLNTEQLQLYVVTLFVLFSKWVKYLNSNFITENTQSWAQKHIPALEREKLEARVILSSRETLHNLPRNK